ncbi:MAG: PAS domain-containing protein, partial [Pseudomonadota bacterium]
MVRTESLELFLSGNSMLEAMGEPLFVINPEMVIEYANPAFYEKFGLLEKDVKKKMNCEEIFGSPLCGTKDCPAKKATRLKKHFSVENILRKDKSLMYFVNSAIPIKSSDGKTDLGTIITLYDISRHKETELKSRQLETNLNVIPTPIMEIDNLFNVLYMNPAGASVTGLQVEEVIGKKCYDLFKTPHCKTEKCGCSQAMKTDAIVTAETIARPRDGVMVPIRYTAASVKDAKGNVKGALEYVMDITEETKQRQAANEKIENLNTIPTPVLSIDTDYNVTYMNPVGASILGMTPDEVVGKKCYNLFKTPHCRTDKCACSQAMKTDAVVTAETIARPREGMMIPIRYTGAPIKDAKGNIKGALEYVQDVTEETKQRQAANEKIENLNTIPTPVLSIDTDYNVTYMNPTGASILGMTPEEVIGKKCYNLFKTPHCRTDKCACSQAMKTDAVVTAETIARPREGMMIPIRYTGAPIK